MGVAKYTKGEKGAITDVEYQSGIKIKPVYTPEDLAAVDFDYDKDLGDPGSMGQQMPGCNVGRIRKFRQILNNRFVQANQFFLSKL